MDEFKALNEMYAELNNSAKWHKHKSLILEKLELQKPVRPTEKKDLLDMVYGKCECGTEVRDDNAFCYRCGKKLDWSKL
jgi:hypothetical protein